MAFAPRMVTLGLLACCSLAACGDDDDDGAFAGVQGSALDVYRTEAGDTVVASDATRWAAIGLRPAGAPETVYPGALGTDGKILIPDAPEGAYLLELTSPPASFAPEEVPFRSFIEDSARSFDASRLFSHRPDVQAMTQPTYLSVNAQLTRPWQDSPVDAPNGDSVSVTDGLFLYSRNAFVVGQTQFADATLQGLPESGAAALAWTFDAKAVIASYLGAGNEHLLDAAKGDDFTVLHQVAKPVLGASPVPTGDPWQAYAYSSVEAVLRPGPVTMADGGTAAIGGAFEAVPQKAFALDYRGSLFNALLADAPPGERSLINVAFRVSHEPSAPEPAFGAFVDLLDVSLQVTERYVEPVCNGDEPDLCADVTSCPRGCNDARVFTLPGDHVHEYAYGNPFAGGQELASINYYFQTSVTEAQGLPADESPKRPFGEVFLQVPAGELNGKPLAPAVGLPRNVTINGQPAPLDRVSAGVGLAPTIAFEPPSLGTPTYYSVRIVDATNVRISTGQAFPRNRTIAGFRLKGTSVVMPSGILQPGRYYWVQIISIAEDTPPNTLFRGGQHSARASTYTGIFTP